MLFYVMGTPNRCDRCHDTIVLAMAPVHRGDAPRCPQCGRFAGMLPWLPPYRAELITYGKQLGDVATATGDSIAVSQRFCDAWLSGGLKGITEFSPFERIRVRPARLGRQGVAYFHVAPKLGNTQVDVDHSVIEYGRPITCDKCKSSSPETVRGFCIDESSWTGEDIFYAWGMPGSIIVTDRVRKLRDDYGLTNINLIPTEEYLWDPDRRWTPWVWQLPE